MYIQNKNTNYNRKFKKENKKLDLCLLSMFLSKIHNIEYGLFEIIVSFYCNIDPSHTKYIIDYLHLYYRFVDYQSITNFIIEANHIMKVKTKLSHNLTKKSLINGILKMITPNYKINSINISYNYIPNNYNYLNDIIINDDFFIIDIKTESNMKLRLIINPSYEYCWIQNYEIIDSIRYSQIKLIDIKNSFTYRKSKAYKRYSRYHPLSSVIKNIELNTIRFFGLSTYYFWDSNEISKKMEKLGFVNQISLC